MVTAFVPLAAASGPIQVPLWFDLTAVSVGALAGAATARRRNFDLIGALVLATVMGLGGGIIRDILIGNGPPAALQDNRFLFTVAVACLVGSFFAGWADGFGSLLTVLDALTLGIYAVVGLQKGLANGLPTAAVVLLGTVAATGGGLMADILTGQIPQVLQPGRWNAAAALAGCVMYVVCHAFGIPDVPLGIGTMAAIVALRLLSVHFDWTAPQPRAIAHVPGTSRRRRRADSGEADRS